MGDVKKVVSFLLQSRFQMNKFAEAHVGDLHLQNETCLRNPEIAKTLLRRSYYSLTMGWVSSVVQRSTFSGLRSL